MAGAAALTGCRGLFTGCCGDFDENLAVFLSDIHVCGNPNWTRWHYSRRELDLRIAEILAMRPLPRHVVTFGDLAFDAGDPRDYAIVRDKFKLLTDAGIVVTHATGNHDRRAQFLDHFPMREPSPVVWRIVSEVHFPTCDLILLDSLVEGEVAGGLDAPQQEWLLETLAKRTRPVFVGAHHPTRELTVKGASIVTALKNCPFCVGWINGHGHTWEKRPLVSWGARNEDTIRGVQLPSAGLYGDIGYVTFRVSETEAVATLHETGYWFNDGLHPDEEPSETDRAIVVENQGQSCRFPFVRRLRSHA